MEFDDLPVIESDATQAVVPPGQAKETKEDTVSISKAELDSLRRERDEARESERYWAEHARSGSPAAVEPVDDGPKASEFLDDAETADPDLEGDTPAKLVDEFASNGLAALSKRGIVTRAEAHKIATDIALKVSRELIGRERQKMSSDDAIMREFPDLKDQESPLFQETAKIYQRAVAMDPTASKTPAALYLAAQAAKERLRDRRQEEATDDRRQPERESERRQRAEAQDGRSRGRAVAADDDMLGEEAKSIIKSMGITDKEFLDARKASGGRGRR